MPKLQKTLGRYDGAMEMKIKRKNIFACLDSIHNTISLSRREQVGLSGLRFEKYFSHHQARGWEKYLSKRSPLKHTCS